MSLVVSLQLDGEVTLAELRDDHGIDIVAPDLVTVAGLFLAVGGTLPQAGATLDQNGYHLQLEEIQGMKITRIKLLPADTTTR